MIAPASASPAAVAPRPGLVRGIGRWDLVAFVVNCTIGAGIFGLPSRAYALTAEWSLVAFVATAAVVGLVVLCFAEVASRFDSTGGPYVYAREAFGPFAGFAVGWLVWLQRLSALAAVANLFVDYLGWFAPPLAAGAGRAAVIVVVTAALTLLNVTGVRARARVGPFGPLAKLVPLLVLMVFGLAAIDPARLAFGPPPPAAAIGPAALLLVFAFAGFDVATIPAGEIRDPRRNLPFAMLAGLAGVTVVYLLIQIVCIGTLPGLAASERPLADAAARVLGPAGGALLALGALISTSGTLLASVLSMPRMLYALAERAQLPAALAATHPRFHTPHVALGVSAVVMLAITLSGTFVYAATLNALIRLAVYAVTALALIALRRRRDVPEARFRVPGGAVTARAATAVCVALVARSSAREARDVAIAVAVGLLLHATYRLALRARRPSGGPA